MIPSIIGHVINGFLILILLITIILNYTKIIKFDLYQIIIILSLFTLIIGIHSLSHLGLEVVYNFNPIQN